MTIAKAYTAITLEANVGGYDTKDLHIIMADKNELQVSFSSDYVSVAETIRGNIRVEDFPRKNWNKGLWKLLWARFRTRCKEP